MEEERRRMRKVTRDHKMQTDPDLSSENRDVAIRHAKLKMFQALHERDITIKDMEEEKAEKKR